MFASLQVAEEMNYVSCVEWKQIVWKQVEDTENSTCRFPLSKTKRRGSLSLKCHYVSDCFQMGPDLA